MGFYLQRLHGLMSVLRTGYAHQVRNDNHKLTELIPDPKFSALPTYPVVLALKGAEQDVNLFASRAKGSVQVPGIPPMDPNKMVSWSRYFLQVNLRKFQVTWKPVRRSFEKASIGEWAGLEMDVKIHRYFRK